MSSRRRNHRGQALAETALVLPVLLLLVIALFDVGRAVFAYNTATNAAREAARLAIVNQSFTKIEERAVLLSPNTPIEDLTVTFYRPSRDTTSSSSADQCLGTTASPIVIGCVAVVEFETSFSAITPLIGSVVGPFSMTARGELPVEFVCPNTVTTNADGCPKQP